MEGRAGALEARAIALAGEAEREFGALGTSYAILAAMPGLILHRRK